ncbi:general secretion pathway protein GspK [Sandaracinobacter neustonicus]|uniref:General secretion pathway protein GspK n=1 Tax=Sandaracinobacter neustonicus TaxID=1715348 RepID=A0A501XQV0_9SPHN|nr:type II secretion system minor pseudopilin GspK [Sandaracinobacter neustonicus]TPE62477.1 general secretion pathway protein GspK [Sandaracinobacter neustonicus]
MKAPASERGAALLAVLAMVVLLAGFATMGLSRLKAAGDRISEAQTQAEAQLLAGAGGTAAVSVIGQLKARARTNPELLTEPLKLELQGGTVEARFADGGNCFNLNSLARPPARTSTGEVPAASRPQDFARLLVATGIPTLEANTIAQATAARLAQTGQLWADASEWAAIPGVTAKHWALAGPLLCALPSRENSAVNINSLTAAQAPLLTGMGLGADEARRAIAARPAAGWGSASDFMNSSGSNLDQNGEAAERMGTSTRWMRLSIVAETPRARVARELLIDTLEQPAAVVSSRWRAVEAPVEGAL